MVVQEKEVMWLWGCLGLWESDAIMLAAIIQSAEVTAESDNSIHILYGIEYV